MIHTDPILICGSGDYASAAALRLYRSGFNICILADAPFDLHYARTFTAALAAGEVIREGLTAMTIARALEKNICQPQDPLATALKNIGGNRLLPVLTLQDVLNSGSGFFKYIIYLEDGPLPQLADRIGDNARWISTSDGLEQVHYRIGRCGQLAGRVRYPFFEEHVPLNPAAKPDLAETVQAPLEGVFVATAAIDELVHEKQELGRINEIPILSPVSGKITGLLNSGHLVPAHTVFAEISHPGSAQSGRVLPAGAFAVAGGVLEALLYDIHLEQGNG